eukprot:NODE_1472_length_2464_cov_9.893881.p1 GENE.NODE_1472_length_2464_cov_9.893881~~NODE_1472_length_2464_cov_9.893881.p1  ORF type:complete len:788 (+),score=185.81 NODE_1472_length_2464_cov_9.893881:165-2366(+)
MSMFQAKAGDDFEQMTIQVQMSAGQSTAHFDVPVYANTKVWSPTKWFLVELQKMVYGNATLGGPTVAEFHINGEPSRPTARIFIFQDDVFPNGIPASRRHSHHWLSFYYMLDRIQRRGKKWWLTLLGVCYEPFHSVVITTLVQKNIIDWACNWMAYGTGTHWRILTLALIEFASMMLVRWADQLQVKNRGRTGGTRMDHRAQLLTKMLTMETADHSEVPGFHWFYTALQNVDAMTQDAYWQVFEVIQSIFALVCTITTLVISRWEERGHIGALIVPLFIAAPVSLCIILHRRQETADAMEKRMECEQAWVNTFAWAAHAGHGLHSLGPRELAWLQQRFSKESTDFIANHQIARDRVSDSIWITRWLGYWIYVLMLYIGASQLIDSRRDDNKIFLAGSFVMLLKLSKGFGTHLTRVNTSVVKFMRGAVSIAHVSKLLNISEHKSLREFATVIAEPLDLHAVVFSKVRFLQPHALQGTEPMGPLRMFAGTALRVPLGSFVRVFGASEGIQMTFMGLVAGIVHPTEGVVSSPNSIRKVMLTPIPIGCPYMTVSEALQTVGAPEHVADRLARVLNLRPSMTTNRLPPGDAQKLAIARVLLRNPQLIALVRPFAFVLPQDRPRLQALLRVWQHGGADLIVRWLSDDAPPALKNALTEQRTLILTGEDMEVKLPTDLEIKLDDYFDADYSPKPARTMPMDDTDSESEPSCSESENTVGSLPHETLCSESVPFLRSCMTE